MSWSDRAWAMSTVFFSLGLHASNTDHGINWWNLGSGYRDAPALGWLSITFLIFAYGMVRAVRRPLALYLEARSRDIRQKIEDGERAKREGEKKLKAYEEKLRTLSGEIEKMRAAFLQQAVAEKAELARLAKELERKILKDAEDTVKADLERSKNRLAKETIEKAMALARARLAGPEQGKLDRLLGDTLIRDLKALSDGGN